MKSHLTRHRPGSTGNPSLRIVLVLSFLLLPREILNAQDVGVQASRFRDGNIFEIYNATSDQITQLQLDVSQDWDVDRLSLSLAYSGSGLLFQDLPERNYHAHVLTLSGSYQLESHDEDDGGEDSSASAADSVRAAAAAIPDSADHFLETSILGAGQFDRQDYSEYDNSIVSAAVAFRQPLGNLVSIRPAYSLSYHSYPNLPGITNVQNIFAVHLATSFVRGGWIVFTPAYAVKSYTTTSSYTYTVNRINPGHGKGGGEGNVVKMTKTIELNTPSVDQSSLSLGWQQKVGPDATIIAGYTAFMTPSTEARVIPDQLRGAVESAGLIGGFAAENEIFDDHYRYSGNAVTLQLQQQLPLSILLQAGGGFWFKHYADPAYDLSDSVVVASHREDHRSEFSILLSKKILFANTSVLKPAIEIRYLRNNSNAPYYDFDKTVLSAAIEYDF